VIAAAYIRVSSRAQTFDTQRDAIERAARARGDGIVTIYEEKRTGKRLTERPELERLRVDARAGRVRRLYVFRLDRLARGGIRDMFEVVDELRRGGVELVSVSDGFDLAGPAAEVVLAVLAWAAQMEHFARNERIAAARERVEAEGGTWGRPRRIDNATVEQILTRRARGETLRGIARAMKIAKGTVTRYLAKARTGQKVPLARPSDSPADRGGQ